MHWIRASPEDVLYYRQRLIWHENLVRRVQAKRREIRQMFHAEYNYTDNNLVLL